ncbi:MAG: GntR family transcriptional regulator [Alphaproteobacteria bacterium]|nr:GntR family transcriptional regulator [Alphaproteobacteria bacterium]TAD89838.1 MAG: GntR family transcriptional regulator [Alphaproteobacteria bacterium]
MPAAARPRAATDTSTEQALSLLRRDIIGGRFPPGSRLKLAELSQRYGLSMMPVREALRRLEGDRLVEVSAHRGATVRPVTVQFLRDLYDVREALEGLLVEACCQRADDAARVRIQTLATAWDAAAERGDTARTLEANRRFHAAINDAGGNAEAIELLSRGWPLVQALRQRIGFSQPRLTDIRAQHHALVQAILAGDSAAARSASNLHCRAARDDLIGQLERIGALSIAGG